MAPSVDQMASDGSSAEPAAAGAAASAAAAPSAPVPATPTADAVAVDASVARDEPLGACPAPCPARSTAHPSPMAPSVSQMAVDGGSRDAAVASAPRRLDGRVAYATLAALPAEAAATPLPSDAGLALIAVLRDLLQLPASKGNGSAPGASAAAAAELVDAAYEGLHGEHDLHAVQLLWAMRAQLRACSELADCADLGAYIVKKYAPVAGREGKLTPAKNKRFDEFARVVALAPRAFYAEFDPDAEAEGESDGESDDLGSDYDDDDNSTAAQMHRFFAKAESWGVSICEPLADHFSEDACY